MIIQGLHISAAFHDGHPYVTVRNLQTKEVMGREVCPVTVSNANRDKHDKHGVPLEWELVEKLECVVEFYESDAEAVARKFDMPVKGVHYLVKLYEAGGLE